MKTVGILASILLVLCQIAEGLVCYRCQYVSSPEALIEGMLLPELEKAGITSDPECVNVQSGTAVSCPANSVTCGTVQASLAVDATVPIFGVMAVPLDVFSRGCFPDDTLYADIDATRLTPGCHQAEDYEDVFQIILAAAEEYSPVLKQINGSICLCDGDSCNGCSGDDDCGDDSDSDSDSDPCESDPCDPNATCEPTTTGFTCTCNDGYQGDGDTCTEVSSTIDCYRCQYVTADNAVMSGSVASAMERLGMTNEPLCQEKPSDDFAVACPIEGASCGTTQATLALAVEMNGNALNAKLEIFSRGCFPDPSSPTVQADDVINGCHDAKEYDHFFEDRFLGGMSAVQGLTAQLNEIGGGICFCNDKHKCNDCKSIEGDECVTTGAGNDVLVSMPLMLITAALLARLWQ